VPVPAPLVGLTTIAPAKTKRPTAPKPSVSGLEGSAPGSGGGRSTSRRSQLRGLRVRGPIGGAGLVSLFSRGSGPGPGTRRETLDHDTVS